MEITGNNTKNEAAMNPCDFYEVLCGIALCKITDDEVFCFGDPVDCICENERKRWEEA